MSRGLVSHLSNLNIELLYSSYSYTGWQLQVTSKGLDQIVYLHLCTKPAEDEKDETTAKNEAYCGLVQYLGSQTLCMKLSMMVEKLSV